MILHQQYALVAVCVAALMGGDAQQTAFQSLLDADHADIWDATIGSNPHVVLTNGILVITGPSGWVVTRKRHSDVVLRFDARADAASIGGVLLRALTEEDRARSTYEVQIAAADGRSGGLLHHFKTDIQSPVPGTPALADTSEWQSYRIECRGDTLKAWVAGQQVLNVRGLVQNVGRIGFLVAKGTIAIRNLEMQEHEWAEPAPPPGVVRSTAEGITAPEILKMVKPQYTARGIGAKSQGDVWLAAVIQTDGRVGDVRVYRSLAPDLDQEAIVAVEGWRFKPAQKDGRSVLSQATISMSFSLK
jgi:TonB family protein